MQAKILLVDDEPRILNLITAYLGTEGYALYTAVDGPQAWQLIQTHQPDLIVLDIMLPGRDGLDLLTQLRRDSNAYVILLTAKSDETDKLVGLTLGADDYLTKPFSPRELVARIKAALRRLHPTTSPTSLPENPPHLLTFTHLRLDTAARRVWIDTREVELTATEFDLLQTLVEHKGLVLSREQLLERVWGPNFFGEIRVVDVHLGHVRQKLGEQHGITTVRGVGYRFEG